MQRHVLTFSKEYIKGRDHGLPNQSLLHDQLNLCERKHLHQYPVTRPLLVLVQVATRTRRNLDSTLKSSSEYGYLTLGSGDITISNLPQSLDRFAPFNQLDT